VLQFAESIEQAKNIWVQDLLADRATDITGKVKIRGGTLTIPGTLIDQIGTSAGDAGDISVPGLVLKIQR